MNIETSIDAEVARLNFNMPENGNRLSQELVIELGARLDQFADNTALKVVVISASGNDFCLGRAAAPPPNKPSALQLRSAMMGPILNVYRAMRRIEVPTLALVQGEAAGFGAALAGSCDITIAADNARFSFPEMKVDMPPTLAMATVLERVQPKALAWMVYTTGTIGAEEALQAGLVSRVTKLEKLVASGEETVSLLTQRQRPALAAVKQYLAQARLCDFEKAADYGANLLAVTLSSR